MEANDEAEASVEEGTSIKDEEYESGTSTSQHKRRRFGTSGEK